MSHPGPSNSSKGPGSDDGTVSRDDARTEILRRVRAALADSPPAVSIPRDYRRTGELGVDAVALFAERVSEYRATIHRTAPDGLAAAVASILAARGVRRLVVPDGVPDDWLAASSVERIGDDPPLGWSELDRADGVITGCVVAIAETGTIVLDGGAGEGRRALSLLPDFHLCVVEDERIVATVPEAVSAIQPARPQTWISGPSATSDIELDRVEGVHGPRMLEVVIVDQARRS